MLVYFCRQNLTTPANMIHKTYIHQEVFLLQIKV